MSTWRCDVSALNKRGIEYVEVRCVDVSPFHPLGIDGEQMRVLDSFLLHCLLAPSPACDDADQDRQAANLEAVVNRGREPGLVLENESGVRCSLRDWANTLLAVTAPDRRRKFLLVDGMAAFFL